MATAVWIAGGLILLIIAALSVSYAVGAADLRLADLHLGDLFREAPFTT